VTAGTTPEILRAGVVGLGAGRAHMRGYVSAPGVRLAAIAGKEKTGSPTPARS